MFETVLKEHQICFEQLNRITETIEKTGELLTRAIESGHKILICGNGGSAADAQHFAAELIGRFVEERSAWPAIALTTDTSILTAVANDYGFDRVFSRQVMGLGQAGDVFIGISTSGNSENIVRAVDEAKGKGMSTVGLLGGDGGALASRVDWPVAISGSTTARIQEVHIFILHFWALQIERHLHPNP